MPKVLGNQCIKGTTKRPEDLGNTHYLVNDAPPLIEFDRVKRTVEPSSIPVRKTKDNKDSKENDATVELRNKLNRGGRLRSEKKKPKEISNEKPLWGQNKIDGVYKDDKKEPLAEQNKIPDQGSMILRSGKPIPHLQTIVPKYYGTYKPQVKKKSGLKRSDQTTLNWTNTQSEEILVEPDISYYLVPWS